MEVIFYITSVPKVMSFKTVSKLLIFYIIYITILIPKQMNVNFDTILKRDGINK